MYLKKRSLSTYPSAVINIHTVQQAFKPLHICCHFLLGLLVQSSFALFYSVLMEAV